MLPRTQINAYMIYQCLNRDPIYSVVFTVSIRLLNSPYSVIIVLASWIHHQSVITFYMSLRICADETSAWQLLASALKDCNGQKFPAASNRPRWAPSYYLWLEWWYVESPPSTKTSVCSRLFQDMGRIEQFWFGVSFWRVWWGWRESC